AITDLTSLASIIWSSGMSIGPVMTRGKVVGF
ncbi:MAG: hypothetical protein ACJAWZ_003894, partial [Paracoccaceae bacterium]